MKTKNYLSKMANSIKPYNWEFGSGKELRFNSNTLPFPPKSFKVFLKSMERYCPINEYADPNYTELKKLLAQYEKISENMLTITNSGDEAIDILAKTFLNPNDFFVVTPPTYEMFSIQSEINRGIPVEVPLENKTWDVNEKKIIEASKSPKTKLIFLCNPNNPTASVIDPLIIEQIVKESDAIVVIDETYREFYGKSSISLLKKYSNLVILRSFSKFAGMAGARVGYLIASKELSEKFNGIRFPMGVSFFSYKLAEFVLKNDKKWIEEQVVSIKKEKDRVAKELQSLGLFVYTSKTNFLLVKTGGRTEEIYKKLKERNIYIRDRSRKKNLDECVRITIRSKEENSLLIAELKKILVAKKDKYAFLDRDGTLIFEPQDTFQIDSLDKLKVLDGVINGLKKLISLGFELILVTNQDGLGTQSFPEASFQVPQKEMLRVFKKNKIKFKNIFVCPHLPSENCICRKPKVGLVEKFIKDNQIDKENSFVCGDRVTDRLFAKNLGVKYIPMKTNGNFYEEIAKEVKA